MIAASILGTGSYIPQKTVTNADLEKVVDTSDEWITTRTGIKERHIAGPGEDTSKIAARAARRALEMASLSPEDIDLIIVATITSDMSMPSCACLVQNELGAKGAYAYDINAACCGFLFALDTAYSHIARDSSMKILVIGAETLSARVDWQDRNTCVLFGDGAGACILTGREGASGLVAAKMRSDGSLNHLLNMSCAPGTNPDLQNYHNKQSLISMAGRDVFKYAVRAMVASVEDLLADADIPIEDIKLVIPHQANIRIINSLAERLRLSEEKIYINIDKYGNTSAATIPIALDEANREGILRPGDLVVLCAFGSGFTWGAAAIRW